MSLGEDTRVGFFASKGKVLQERGGGSPVGQGQVSGSISRPAAARVPSLVPPGKRTRCSHDSRWQGFYSPGAEAGARNQRLGGTRFCASAHSACSLCVCTAAAVPESPSSVDPARCPLPAATAAVSLRVPARTTITSGGRQIHFALSHRFSSSLP